MNERKSVIPEVRSKAACGFRLDLLVEHTIIVELKSVEIVQEVHKKQLLTYLRSAKKPLGLLINFNEAMLKDSITRLPESSMPRQGLIAWPDFSRVVSVSSTKPINSP